MPGGSVFHKPVRKLANLSIVSVDVQLWIVMAFRQPELTSMIAQQVSWAIVA